MITIPQMNRKAVAAMKGWMHPYFRGVVPIYITWGSWLKHLGHGNLPDMPECWGWGRGGESQPLKIISIMVKPRMCWCSKMHYHWSGFAPSSDSPSLWFRIQFLIQVVKTDPISYIPYVCSLSESYVLRALICRIVPWVRFKWAQKFSSGNYPFFSSELRIRGFQLIRQSVDFLP